MEDLSGDAVTDPVKTAQHYWIQRAPAKRSIDNEDGELVEGEKKKKKKKRKSSVFHTAKELGIRVYDDTVSDTLRHSRLAQQKQQAYSSTARKKANLIENLPYEITVMFFQGLELVDQLRLGLTCPKLYVILKSTFHPGPIQLDRDIQVGNSIHAIGFDLEEAEWPGFQKYRFASYPIYKFLNADVYGYEKCANEVVLAERYSDFRWNGFFKLWATKITIPDPYNQDALGWHRATFKVIESCPRPHNPNEWKEILHLYIIVRKFKNTGRDFLIHLLQGIRRAQALG